MAKFDPSKFIPANNDWGQQGSGGGEDGGSKRYLPTGAQSATAGNMPSSQEFITGRNTQGVQNGWNTEFFQTFYNDYSKAIEDGTAVSYFRDKRDGIAQWDDPDAGIKFGDVFQGGKKVENLYDTYGREFADNVMRPFVMSADDMQRGESVDAKRQFNNQVWQEAQKAGDGANRQDARYARQQADVQKRVEDKKESWDQDTADATTVAAAAAAGALTWGAIGSVIPGIGTAAGAVGGGLIGGGLSALGGWMNRDELQDTFARQEVQAEMEAEQSGLGVGWGTKLQTWGGMTMKGMNPLGNIVHGAVDENQGDGKSGYYAVDENGQLKRPQWATALDMGSEFVTGIASFATPFTAAAYRAGMVANIGGQVTELTATGGKRFDNQRGQFDNIFFDENPDGTEGKFSLISAASGIGSIGIDAVQLGMTRGLGSAAGKLGRTVPENKALAWATGMGKTEFTGVGKESIVRDGMKFFAKDGQITRARLSVASLAPSEMVSAANIRMTALLAKPKGSKLTQVTADELYQASVNAAKSTPMMRSALLNGFGEAYEEAAQSVLDPLSHVSNDSFSRMLLSGFSGSTDADQSISLREKSVSGTLRAFSDTVASAQIDSRDVLTSALTGFVSGAGMTIGSRLYKGGVASEDKIQYNRMVAASQAFNPDAKIPTFKEWMKQPLAKRSQEKLELEAYNETLEAMAAKAAKDSQYVVQGNMQGARESIDRWQRELADSERQRANDVSSTSYVITWQQGIDDHEIHMSVNTAVKEYEKLETQTRLVIQQLEEQLQQPNLDPAVAAEVQAKLDSALALQPLQAAVLHGSQRTKGLYKLQAEYYDAATTDAQRSQLVSSISKQLRWMWQQLDPQDSVAIARSKAATLPLLRPPADNAGSAQARLIQVDNTLSVPTAPGEKTGTGDNMLLTGPGGAMVSGLDYDGDRMLALKQLLLSDDTYRKMRMSGAFVLPQDEKTVTASLPQRVSAGIAPDTNTSVNVALLKADLKSTSNPGVVKIAEDTIRRLKKIVKAYGPELQEQLDRRLRRGTDAHTWLLDEIVNSHITEMDALEQASWSNELFRINSAFRREMWKYQRARTAAIAAVRSAKDPSQPDDMGMDPDSTPFVMDAGHESDDLLRSVAATYAQDAWVAANQMYDLFRVFQSINYHPVRSNQQRLLTPEHETAIDKFAALYARANSEQLDDKTDLIQNQNRVINNTMKGLERMLLQAKRDHGLSDKMGMLQFANLEMPITMTMPDGNTVLRQGSVLQWVLAQEIAREEARLGQPLPEDVQRKHSRLLQASAAQTVINVFSGTSIETLLPGYSSGVFGGNLTVGQIFMKYFNQDEYNRSRWKNRLRDHHFDYIGERKSGDVPYAWPEKAEDAPSAYKSFVDALLEAGNKELTYDPKTQKLSGRVADAGQMVSTQMTDGIASTWKGLQQSGFSRTSRDSVLAAFDANPELYGVYLSQLTAEQGLRILNPSSPMIRAFMVDALTAKTLEEAEVILWRAKKLIGWMSLGAMDEGQAVEPRRLADIKDRTHLLFWRLAQPENRVLQAAFLKKYYNSRSLEELFNWINDPANGIRQNEAPYTPYYSDLADIDPAINGGKVSMMVDGAQERTAIADFKQKAEMYVQTAQQQQAQATVDDELFFATQDALADYQNNPATAGLVRNLMARLHFASQYGYSMAPAARMQMVAGNLLMHLSATDKGISVEFAQRLGGMLMASSGPQFGTGEETVLSSVTAYDLDKVLRNPKALTNPLTLTRADGGVIEWPGFQSDPSDPLASATLFLELWETEEFRPLLSLIATPQGWEAGQDNSGSLRSLWAPTFENLVKNTPMATYFGRKTAVPESHKLLTLLEGISDTQEATAWMMKATVAATTGAKNSLNAQAVQELSNDAAKRLAELISSAEPLARIKYTGPELTDPRTGFKVKPATLLDAERIKQQTRIAKLAREGNRKTNQNQKVRNSISMSIVLENMKRLEKDGRTASQEYAFYQDVHDDILARSDSTVVAALFNRYVPLDNTSSPTWEAENLSTLWQVYRRARNASLLSQAPWSDVLRKIHQVKEPIAFKQTDRGQLPVLSPKEWMELSNVVLGHELQKYSRVTGPTLAGSPLTGEMDDLLLRDPSFGFLLDVLDSRNPLIKAMARARQMNGLEQSYVGDVKDIERAVNKLFLSSDGKSLDRSRYGGLTDAAVENMQAGLASFLTAAAEPGIQSGGSIPPWASVVSAATARNTRRVPQPDQTREVHVTASQLEGRAITTAAGNRVNPDKVMMTYPGGQVFMRTDFLDGKFISGARLLRNGQVLDAEFHKRGGVQRTFLGTAGAEAYGFISRSRLFNALKAQAAINNESVDTYEIQLDMFHYADRPAGAEWADNLFFTGVNGDADTIAESAIAESATLIGQTASKRALQAKKKSQLAILRATKVPAEEKQRIMANWHTNMTDALDELTWRVVQPGGLNKGLNGKQSKGSTASMPAGTATGIRELLKMMHVVVKDDGTVYSMDEVLHAQNNPQNDITFDPATDRLVPLSMDTLTKLLSSRDSVAVGPNATPQTLSLLREDIGAWAGSWDAQKLRELAPGIFDVAEYADVFRSSKRLPSADTVRTHNFMSDLMRKTEMGQLIHLKARQGKIAEERRQNLPDKTRRGAIKSARKAAQETNPREAAAYVQSKAGLTRNPVMTGKSVEFDATAVENATAGLMDLATATAYIYHPTVAYGTTQQSAEFGRIWGRNDLEQRIVGKAKYDSIAMQDLVTIPLDEYNAADSELAWADLRRDLDLLMQGGATIHLSTDTGQRELLSAAMDYLTAQPFYTAHPGARNVWTPDIKDEGSATQRAYTSVLTETGTYGTANTQIVFLSDVLGTDEGSAHIIGSKKGDSKIVSSVPVPINKWVGTANDSLSGIAQGLYLSQNIEADIAVVENNTAELLERAVALDPVYANHVKLGNQKRADRRKQQVEDDLARAIRRLRDNIGVNGLPQANTDLEFGDIIILRDNQSSQMMLYRYGFAPPTVESLREQWTHDSKIAMYLPSQDPSVSSAPGKILSWESDPMHGLRVNVLSDIQHIGGKWTFGGLKIVAAPTPDDFELPPLVGTREARTVVNPQAARDKSVEIGVVRDWGTFMQYFGWNGTEKAVARVLFGNDSADSLAKVGPTLKSIRREMGARFSAEQVNDMIQREMMDPIIDSTIAKVAAMQEARGADWSNVKKVLKDWSANVDGQIFAGVLRYLSYSKAEPEHILKSEGMISETSRQPGFGSRHQPLLFTQIFDSSPALRKYAVDELNQQITRTGEINDAGQMVGWRINEDYTVDSINAVSKYNSTGWLGFGDFSAAPTNPESNRWAADRSDSQSFSEQFAQVLGMGYGATMTTQKNLPKLNRLLDGKDQLNIQSQTGQNDFDKRDIASIVKLFNSVDDGEGLRMAHTFTQNERDYLEAGREALKQLKQRLAYAGWSKAEIAEYEAARRELAEELGFDEAADVVIDYWTRQFTLKPSLSKKQLNKMSATERKALAKKMDVRGEPSFDDGMGAISEIRKNVRNNLLPTAYFPVSQIDRDSLWLLHEASVRTGWQVQTNLGGPASLTSDWNDWIAVSFGTSEISINEKIEPIARPWNDAMFQSYGEEPGLFSYPPITSSKLQGELLFSPGSLGLTSLDPGQAAALRNTGYIAFSADRDHLFDYRTEALGFSDSPSSDPAVQRRSKRLRSYRKTNEVPEPYSKDSMNLRKYGLSIASTVNQQQILLRIGTNLRAGNALMHPLLPVGAILEGWQQNVLENATNLLAGNDSSSILVRQVQDTVNKAGLSLRISPYSVDELKVFRRTDHVLGSNSDFKGMVGSEFKMDVNNATLADRATGWWAKFAGRVQDPYWGMSQRKVANIYRSAAMRGIQESGYNTSIDPVQMSYELMRDPLWLKKNHRDLHEFGMRAIANMKNVRKPVMSIAWQSMITPLTTSSNIGVQTLSTVGLQWPMMFLNYGANRAMQLTGLQGADHLLATFLTGKERGFVFKGIRRGVQAIAGKDAAQYNESEVYDFREALEGFDAGHAMLKGNISLTMTLMAALATQSLNLLGEDEEDRKRRQRARYQGAAYLYDPLALEQDFRNRDTIYLDNIPILSDIFRVTEGDDKGRSMAQMNFLSKGLLSPMLGVTRFLESGNPMDIVGGFEDAVSAIPLLNTSGWNDAVQNFSALMKDAQDTAAKGGDDSEKDAVNKFIDGLFTLERFMFENAFINELYQGMDKYDRDNYAKPLLNADGEYDLNNVSQTIQPTDNLVEVRDPETGEIKQVFDKYDSYEAQVRGYTERYFTAGLVGKIVDMVIPGKQGLWRYDQVVKQRTFKKEEYTVKEGYAMVTALMAGIPPEDMALPNGELNRDKISLKFLTYESRREIQAILLNETEQAAINAGLNKYEVDQSVRRLRYGDPKDPSTIGWNNILWGRYEWEGVIPLKENVTYNQRNTNYVKGPDGKFYAGGVQKGLAETLLAFSGLRRYSTAKDSNLGTDQVLNNVDTVAGINTGLRNLERITTDEPLLSPEETGEKTPDKKEDDDDKNGRGWKNYGRRGWKNYGGGGRRGWRNFGRGGRRGGGGGGGSFSRLDAPADNRQPYGQAISGQSLDNVTVRRASIRRERTDSEKGRLRPWQ